MADRYDYREAVKNDLKEFIGDRGFIDNIADFTDLEAFREEVYDEAWTADSVTGNGSGSYTFSTWQAEENLCHNMDLLAEALADFGDGKLDPDKGAEHYDVTIRCWLLGQVIDEVLEELGIEDDDPRFCGSGGNDDE